MAAGKIENNDVSVACLCGHEFVVSVGGIEIKDNGRFRIGLCPGCSKAGIGLCCYGDAYTGIIEGVMLQRQVLYHTILKRASEEQSVSVEGQYVSLASEDAIVEAGWHPAIKKAIDAAQQA